MKKRRKERICNPDDFKKSKCLLVFTILAIIYCWGRGKWQCKNKMCTSCGSPAGGSVTGFFFRVWSGLTAFMMERSACCIHMKQPKPPESQINYILYKSALFPTWNEHSPGDVAGTCQQIISLFQVETQKSNKFFKKKKTTHCTLKQQRSHW